MVTLPVVANGRRVGAVLGACALAALVSAVASAVACIVAPPPDLAPQPVGRPTILHDSVSPPADQILTEAQIPDAGTLTFLVPVDLVDPSKTFSWEVFIDYDPYASTAPVLYGQVQPTPGSVDGGITIVPFSLDFEQAPLDTTYCHRIEFLVAYNFSAFHTPDSLGGDSLTWLYNGAGGVNGCPPFDASALGDSGVPLTDAGPDQGLVVPESGSDL
jgi:hypothetical protein